MDGVIRQSRFEPVEALVIYRRGGREEGRSRSGFDHYVTRHTMVDGVIGAGRPITRKTVVELCAALSPRMSKSMAFIPQEVIAYAPLSEQGTMVWWSPATVRMVLFDGSLGLRSGKAPVPPLLFAVSAGNLHVWTLRRNSRPAPDSAVFGAPFFNVDRRGVICMGNVRLPRSVLLHETKTWESLFFGSAFTSHHPPALKGITPEALWATLVTKGRKRFPMKHLVPRGTVSDVLKCFSQEG